VTRLLIAEYDNTWLILRVCTVMLPPMLQWVTL